MSATKRWIEQIEETEGRHNSGMDARYDAEYNEYLYWAEYAEYIKTINEGK